MYDEKGNITRDGAEQVIREGGSVAIKGKMYSRVQDLPDEADFASTSPEATDAARKRLEQQIKDAQGQLSRLGPVGGVAEVKTDEGGSPNAAGRRHAGKS